VASKSNLQTDTIFFGAFITTVIILPEWSYDPVSAPKLVIVALTAGLGLSMQLIQRNGVKGTNATLDIFSILVYSFVALLLLNVLVNHYAFSERIYGIRGRGTGLLAFISLATISYVIARNKSSIRLFSFLLLSNVLVCGYFVLQTLKIDPFPVENFYSAPSSTLGNPNFVSGFSGFSTLAILYFVDRRNKFRLIIASMFLLLNLFVLYRSDSVQGLLGLMVGAFVYISLNLARSTKLRITLWFHVVALPLILVALSGFLGRGPLARALESSSVLSRLDYWRAAIRMAGDNLAFGVGMDGFGDFYRMYRDQAAINRFGPEQTSDSAHNVFLDLFAYGGIPLGTVFLILSTYPAVLLLVKVLKSSDDDRIGILLLTIWVAFQIQACVSVNQLGVAIWGWILFGSMTSHCRNRELHKSESSKNKRNLSGLNIMSGTLLAMTAPLVVFPQLISEIKFLSYANQADGNSLNNLVTAWPQDSRRLNLIARGWIDVGNLPRARELILEGAASNPNYYPNWYLLYKLPNATPQEREKALLEMLRLDPITEPK
jgi:hypothetical protein